MAPLQAPEDSAPWELAWVRVDEPRRRPVHSARARSLATTQLRYSTVGSPSSVPRRARTQKVFHETAHSKADDDARCERVLPAEHGGRTRRRDASEAEAGD